MNNAIFILNTVTPIFLIVIVGWGLRKIGIIQESFIKQSTLLVFKVALPTLLFLKLATVDIRNIFDSNLVLAVYISEFSIFFLSWLIAIVFIKKGQGRGVFIQGSFRSNNVIIGLALILNIYSGVAVSKTLMILIFLVPLNNVLSVIALSISDKYKKELNSTTTLVRSIVFNPIIVSPVIAILFSLLHIPVPPVIINTGNYIAAITLPLALIGIGGSLRIKHLQNTSFITSGATIIKVIIAPIIAASIGYFMGYTGFELGIIFILFACPTAIVSFVLADAMTPHGEIAGNIVLTTTVVSSITISIGLMVLAYLNLI